MSSLLRILVIEDNPGDVALLENMLTTAGIMFELHNVERLSAGIERIKEERFDAILLDLGLPDSSGIETLVKFSAYEPSAPIVVLTGLADEAVGTAAVIAGAQDYLVKGQIDTHLLARSISHAIERKRSAQLLKMAADEWLTSFNAMADGVSIHAADLTILKANKALLELLGKSASEVIGKQCPGIFHQNDCPVAACPVRETIHTGQKASTELFEPTLNKWLNVSTSPIFDESGSLTRVVHTVRDITERRKMELQLRQSQKMESIGTLAGGIAHDFNNILTVINGYGTLALMKIGEDEPLLLYMQNILEAAERAADLTRDLLLFSRKQSAERVPLDVNAVMERSRLFLKKVVSEDIIFSAEVHGEPLMVLANEHQLDQVLMNLVTNASDAMPHGGTLSVSSAKFTMDSGFVAVNGFGQPGLYAQITVADNGTGMDRETRQHIFDPFFTTKEVGKGTGLGLAVVYGIIKQHDGYITVYSEPGTGTMFTIFLPLVADDSHGASTVQQTEAVPGGSETILLAEDDELVRRLALRVLTEHGYEVIEAVDGLDAVSKFTENSAKIDLLLFDLIMPRMNGKEAYDRISKLRPAIKVIFSSGYAPESIQEKVQLEGSIHLLAKPTSPQMLLRTVRSALDADQ